MALDTYTDIKAWILRRAEEPTDGTSDFDENAIEALVEAWRDLYIRHPWLCLYQFPPAAIVLPLPIDGLTLTAAIGTSVVGALSAAPAGGVSVQDWLVIPTGVQQVIRITAHTGGQTAVTLDAVGTALSGTSVRLAKVDFTLPAGFGLFADGGWWGQDKSFVPVRDDEEMRRQYPDPPPQGLTVLCARIGKTRVRFSHYADVIRRLEAAWTLEPSDPSANPGQTLVLDPHLRTIFANMALAYLLTDKSDTSRADRILAVAEKKIDAAITYENRLRMGLGREGRKTQLGPYHDGSPFGRIRNTRGPY